MISQLSDIASRVEELEKTIDTVLLLLRREFSKNVQENLK